MDEQMRCKTCKWWSVRDVEESTSQASWLNCHRIERPGCLFEPNDSLAEYVSAAPDFGCVQWEARQ